MAKVASRELQAAEPAQAGVAASATSPAGLTESPNPAERAPADAEGTSGLPERKVAFTNPMDQLLSMVAPKEPGDSVPPVPIGDDEEFTPEQEKQMFERLVALDDDSDAVLERKELVQAMRNEYVELKRTRGWRFVNYIKALEAKANLDSDVLAESWKIHETVFNDPDISDEKYEETLRKINKVLEGRGIRPITPPEEDSAAGDLRKEEGVE